MWRSLTLDDIENYTKNVAGYNASLRGEKKDQISVQMPKDLQLFRDLASGQLPEDFMLIIGRPEVSDGCGDARGWKFEYTSREILVDAVSIRNVSSQPIRLDGLFGSTPSATNLRALPDQNIGSRANGSRIDLSLSPVTLGPDQSILYPTRIKFLPDFRYDFIYPQTSSLLSSSSAQAATAGIPRPTARPA